MVRLFGVLTLAFIAAGCQSNTDPAATVPLHVTDESTHEPVGGAIIVQLVRATGWVPYTLFDSGPRYQKVRIAGIFRVSQKGVSLRVPGDSWVAVGLLSGLASYQSPDIRAFAPGFFQVDLIDDGNGGMRTYFGPAFQADGPTLPLILRPNKPLSADANDYVREEGRSSLRSLLGEQGFWADLRGWYFWGRNKAEIKTICQAVAEAAEYFQGEGPDYALTDSQEMTVAWCRQISPK